LDLKYQFKDIDFYEKYFGKPMFIDLPAIPDEELKNHENIGPVEVILKYVRQKAETLELKFPELVGDLHVVDDTTKVIVLKYVVDFLNLSGEEMIKIIQECLPKSEGIIMNAREEWTQEGIEKGMQQGMQKISEEIALNMLTKGLSDQLIQEVTQLSSEKICELKRKIRH
jgi:predicted transposase/invertase (TIGR01784 family)